MEDISWVGILVGAVALFVLGGVWYTVLFGKAFQEELGLPKPAKGDSPSAPPVKELVGQFIGGLVLSLVLAVLIGESSAGYGAGVGFAGGLLVAAALGQFYLFEGRTIRHLLINVGYIVVGLTLIGLILGAFQAA